MKSEIKIYSRPSSARCLSALALTLSFLFYSFSASGMEDIIPVSSGLSLTVFEQTGRIFETTFSRDDLLAERGEFLTDAGEKYTLTTDGTLLTISCLHDNSRSYPGLAVGIADERTVVSELDYGVLPGYSAGNNIVAVRLDGNPDFPSGLWASFVADYSLGGGGLAQSCSNSLGDPGFSGPWGDRHYTALGTGESAITLGFSPLIIASAKISETPDWNEDLTLDIHFPEGYTPSQVDFYSLELVRVGESETAIRPLGWWNILEHGDGAGLVLQIEFSRGDIAPFLLPGDNILLLRGSLSSVLPFEARVIIPVN